MSDDAIFPGVKAPSENEVAFDYVKAPEFRAVWADGALGGITPRGLIHFALYAERTAIPRRQVFAINKVTDDFGELGAEVAEKQVTRGSIVREMAMDVMMSPEGAEALAQWLLQRVSELRGKADAAAAAKAEKGGGSK